MIDVSDSKTIARFHGISHLFLKDALVPEPWLAAPAEPHLPVDMVHIWKCSLDETYLSEEELWQTLDDSERQRAGFLHFGRDRRHFIAAHGVLRLILSRYLKIPPHYLKFNYGINGKPYLANSNIPELKFNLSHSVDRLLFAFTCKHEIGIDIEYIDLIPEVDNVARFILTEREYTMLKKTPFEHKLESFYEFWTLKEACIKAFGFKLAESINQFEIWMPEHRLIRLPRMGWKIGDGVEFSYQLIKPDPGYMSAVVVADQNLRPVFWNWSYQ